MRRIEVSPRCTTTPAPEARHTLAQPVKAGTTSNHNQERRRCDTRFAVSYAMSPTSTISRSSRQKSAHPLIIILTSPSEWTILSLVNTCVQPPGPARPFLFMPHSLCRSPLPRLAPAGPRQFLFLLLPHVHDRILAGPEGFGPSERARTRFTGLKVRRIRPLCHGPTFLPRVL